MAKFSSLVKNEYIKTLKKLSTKIMLILIIVAALGMTALIALAKQSGESFENEYIVEYDYEIEELKNTKPNGYEDDIKFYSYLNDLELSYSDPFLTLIWDMHETLPVDQVIENSNKLIKDNDWEQVCRIMVENTKSEATRWAYQYRLDNNVPFGDTWKDDLIYTITSSKEQLEYYNSESQNGELVNETQIIQDELTLAEYRLENNIEVSTENSESILYLQAKDIDFWAVFNQSASLVTVIGLLIIVIAGGSVASEFSTGTIKFLLINPAKRWKILMSKYFTVITFGYLMIFALFIVMIPIGGIFFGFNDLGASYLTVENGLVQETSSILHVALSYLTNSISIIVMATLAFAVSALFKSSALSIGISVFLMLSGTAISNILSALNMDWARYLITSNLDLSAISNGNSLFAYQTVSTSVIIIVAHLAVFLLTAWDGFTKREV